MDPTTIIKHKTAQGDLRSLQVERQSVIYRTLSPLEYTYVREYTDNGQYTEQQINQLIISLAVIDPVPLNLNLPGSQATVAHAVLDSSIYTDQEFKQRMEDLKKWAATTRENNYAVNLAFIIAGRVQNVNLLELLNLPIGQLMRLAALIEEVGRVPVFEDSPQEAPQIDPAKLQQMQQSSNRAMPSQEEIQKVNDLLAQAYGE